MPEEKPVEEEKKKVREKKGKKPRSKSKHKNVQIWKKYEGAKAKGNFCRRCGSGVFMADHGSRQTCGRCHYAEIKK